MNIEDEYGDYIQSSEAAGGWIEAKVKIVEKPVTVIREVVVERQVIVQVPGAVRNAPSTEVHGGFVDWQTGGKGFFGR